MNSFFTVYTLTRGFPLKHCEYKALITISKCGLLRYEEEKQFHIHKETKSIMHVISLKYWNIIILFFFWIFNWK